MPKPHNIMMVQIMKLIVMIFNGNNEQLYNCSNDFKKLNLCWFK